MFAKPMPRVCAGVSGNCIDTVRPKKHLVYSTSAESSKTTIQSFPDIEELSTIQTIKNMDESRCSLNQSNFIDSSKTFSPSILPDSIPNLVATQIKCSNLEIHSKNQFEIPVSVPIEETNDCEIPRCKELMMLQVSLISRQQDLLKLRDKEIMQLKAENQSFKCRLERMERRISLSKKHKDLFHDAIFTASASKKGRKVMDETKKREIAPKLENETSTEFKPVPTSTQNVQQHMTSSYVLSQTPNLTKTFSGQIRENRGSSCAEASPVHKSIGGICSKHERVPVPVSFIERCQNQLLSSIVSSPMITVKTNDGLSPASNHSNVAFKICDRCPHCIAMVTEVARLLSIVNNAENKTEISSLFSVLESNKYDESMFTLSNIGLTGVLGSEWRSICPYYKQFWLATHNYYTLSSDEVEENGGSTLNIPTWQLQKMQPLVENNFNLENDDDETYLHRHTKFEFAEKRRKRWDIQRIREYRYNEKLRQKLLKQERQEEGIMETFLPSIYDVETLMVEETLPINIFGYSLPFMQPEEFTFHPPSIMDTYMKRKPS